MPECELSKSTPIKLTLWQQFHPTALSKAGAPRFPIGEAVRGEGAHLVEGEVCNLLDIGYLILKSAAFRTESRGGHYRLDYPLTDPDWCRHTLIQHNNWYAESLNI